MPGKEGRTGEVANTTAYKRIELNVPHPELLQPGVVRGNKSASDVLDRGKVPGWNKSSRYAKQKGKVGY